jgi:hypothetical protein
MIHLVKSKEMLFIQITFDSRRLRSNQIASLMTVSQQIRCDGPKRANMVALAEPESFGSEPRDKGIESC